MSYKCMNGLCVQHINHEDPVHVYLINCLHSNIHFAYTELWKTLWTALKLWGEKDRCLCIPEVFVITESL